MTGFPERLAQHQEDRSSKGIVTAVEVVPPPGPNAGPLLADLKSLSGLPLDAFSVATNPLAKPRMSALALCALIQKRLARPAIMHATTRDHNCLSVHSLLCGAVALGIETVLVATGDFIALGDRMTTTTVRDVNVFDLVRKAREVGLHTGVVLDPSPMSSGFRQAVRRLERKVEAGAQFVVTQPVYDEAAAEVLADATMHVGIPLLMGVLPLRTSRHADFLHHRVVGITVPTHVRDLMAYADHPVAEGVANARAMLAVARERFAGVCVMPPFNHYEVLFDILPSDG